MSPRLPLLSFLLLVGCGQADAPASASGSQGGSGGSGGAGSGGTQSSPAGSQGSSGNQGGAGNQGRAGKGGSGVGGTSEGDGGATGTAGDAGATGTAGDAGATGTAGDAGEGSDGGSGGAGGGGAGSGGAESGGAENGGAESGGAESGGAAGSSGAGVGVFLFDDLDSVIDFRRYWPSKKTTVQTRRADGVAYGYYTFEPAGDGALPETSMSAAKMYTSYLDQGKPGSLYLWHKAYGDSSGSCLATIAHLYFGEDRSVVEAGDWLKTSANSCTEYVAFGYTDPTHKMKDGLAWSAPGGMRTPETMGATPAEAERYGIGTSRQINPGDEYKDFGPLGYLAWNKTMIIDTLASFTPAYGRDASGVWGPGKGKTYQNVIRMVMFHGTKKPTNAGYKDIDCSGSLKSIEGYPGQYFYLHFPGYNSYTSEYYFAREEGLLQETLLYVENGEYWGQPDCSMGLLFSKDSSKPSLDVSYRDPGD